MSSEKMHIVVKSDGDGPVDGGAGKAGAGKFNPLTKKQPASSIKSKPSVQQKVPCYGDEKGGDVCEGEISQQKHYEVQNRQSDADSGEAHERELTKLY